jgi:hypothetical protein
LIWHEGLDEWTEAENIDSLKTFFIKTTAPKIPALSKEPPKFEKPKQTLVQPVKVQKKNNGKTIKILKTKTLRCFFNPDEAELNQQITNMGPQKKIDRLSYIII